MCHGCEINSNTLAHFCCIHLYYHHLYISITILLNMTTASDTISEQSQEKEGEDDFILLSDGNSTVLLN